MRRDYWESGKQKHKATDKQQGQRKGIDGRLEVREQRNMGAKTKKKSLRATVGYLFIISISKTVPCAKP